MSESGAEGDGLGRLRELLDQMGGLVATLLEPAASHGALPASSRVAQLAAAGPRAAGMREEYELLVEAIYEGYLLHYRRGRLLRVPEGELGLGLLAGDQLYAVGLARLVAIGDALAVSELADTITLSALAQAAGEQALAEAVWEAGARAVGWGSSEAHRRAKQLVCEGRPGALDAMRTSAALGCG
jgi:hypothetical protein